MSPLVRTRLLPRRGRLAAITALLLLPAPLLAQAPPPSLSLDQALRLARENNPAFLQQRNDADVARSAVRAAYGGLLPRVSASSGFGYTASGERRFGSVEFGQQPDYYSSDYAVGMSLELSGATLLQPSVERSQRRATERRVGGAAAGLDAQVARQYLTVLQTRERVAQAEREVARTAEHVRLAQARLEVGAGTPLDVQRAEVQKGRAEVAVVQARNNAAIAVLALGELVGTPLDPAVELTSEFRIFEPEWQPAELVEVALQSNPSLLAAQAGSDAARTSVQAARSRYLPSLNLSVGMRGSVYQAGDIDALVQRDLFGLGQRFEGCRMNNDLRQLTGRAPQDCSGFNVQDPAVVASVREMRQSQNSGWPFSYTQQPLSASLSLSLPIFDGFGRRLQVDQAQAAASDARHAVRAEELRLRQEVGAAVRNLQTAYETARLQEKVRTSAEEELRLARERFRFGAASSIEVTDAQTSLAQAEQEQIDAVYNFHQSLATLEALLGRPLR